MTVEDEYKLSAMRDYIAKVAAARQAYVEPSVPSWTNCLWVQFHSASSKSYEPVDGSLSGSAHANLQDLGIVPQTIFFSVRGPDDALNASRNRLQVPGIQRTGSSSAAHSPRSPASVDSASRAPGSRNVSGQPLEDLRRRLALNAASAASSPTTTSNQREVSSETGSSRSGTDAAGVNGKLELQRTVSNASTDASDTTTGTTGTAASASTLPAAPRSRVRLNAVEVGKVAPAVAEDTTNAMGLFDIEARYRENLEDGEARSVAADVLSQTPTPNRRTSGALPHPTLPQRFLSTYGEFHRLQLPPEAR